MQSSGRDVPYTLYYCENQWNENRCRHKVINCYFDKKYDGTKVSFIKHNIKTYLADENIAKLACKYSKESLLWIHMNRYYHENTSDFIEL